VIRHRQSLFLPADLANDTVLPPALRTVHHRVRRRLPDPGCRHRAIQDKGHDGTIDYLIDQTNPAAPQRRIRWYGMPRDVAGAPNGGPDVGYPGVASGGNLAANSLVDVVPLRDVLEAVGIDPLAFPVAPPGSIQEVSIERNLNATLPKRNNYLAVPAGGMGEDDRYIVAWGPDTANQPRPSLIRIVFTIDDPTGRLPEGQTFEYVFKVGG
jgi:hypothetical protein